MADIQEIISNKKCIGCSIGNGEFVPFGGIIYETENFSVAQDAEVLLDGFLIIQSKKHIRSIDELTREESIELSNVIYDVRKAIKDLEICDEIIFVQEETSKHFHIWLFPEYPWIKEKFGKGIKHLRDINEYIIENVTENDKEKVLNTINRLKEYFKEEE